jgi:hypothetical protein
MTGLELHRLAMQGIGIFLLLFIGFAMFGCKTLVHRNASQMLTMETSAALEEACRYDGVTAEDSDLRAEEQRLGVCLGSQLSARTWSTKIFDRFRRNWPKDFASRGQKALTCLTNLTRGAVLRYLDDLSRACERGEYRPREILAAITEEYADPCFDFVRMTANGCFVVRSCSDKKIDPTMFGLTNAVASAEVVLCNDRIQKIHGIKDPTKNSLLYNYSYVSELTGNQSQNRITYGPPNCHGTVQAAAGGVFDDLKLETIQYARLYNRSQCETAVNQFFESHRDNPISKIPMSPGGVIVNMKYDSCQKQDCGKVALWVDDCSSNKLDLAVFIDGMCIECWEEKLSGKGLVKHLNDSRGKHLIPGSVLTQRDHSVIVLAQSQGMCFYYEATSPYGPPQLRTAPCSVLNHRFSGQYCPNAPSIVWQTQ